MNSQSLQPTLNPPQIPAGYLNLMGYVLENLIKSRSFTAKQILTAVEQDIADATAKNINIADIYHQISKLVLQALDLLSLSEQQQFVSTYSVEIGKLQRRAGAEYLNVIKDLITQHKLEFIKGKFLGYFPLTTVTAGCEYLDSENHEQKVFDLPISAIVNCAGFQGVSRSASVLIQNLIQRKICVPNNSDRGFLINKNFETSKNFYLMGPLVAGNIDGNLRVWHAESCQRIIDFSQILAKVLIYN